MVGLEFSMPPGGVNGTQLLAELQAAGIPATTVSISGADKVVIGGVDESWRTQCQVVLDAHRPAVLRELRPVNDILTDLLALTTAQQTNIRTDLLSGTPPKWRLSNSDAVWASAASFQFGTGSLQARALAVAVAFYCREFPTYLVHPAWDASINVPGDRPAA